MGSDTALDTRLAEGEFWISKWNCGWLAPRHSGGAARLSASCVTGGRDLSGCQEKYRSFPEAGLAAVNNNFCVTFIEVRTGSTVQQCSLHHLGLHC